MIRMVKIAFILCPIFAVGLFSGCFVQGEERSIPVTIQLETDDAAGERVDLRMLEEAREASFALAAEVSIDAADFDSPMVEQTTLSSFESGQKVEFLFEEVPAGNDRLFDAVVFLFQAQTLTTFQPEQAKNVHLTAGVTKDVILICTPLDKATVTMAAKEPVSWGFLIDEATGFELPSSPCEATEENGEGDSSCTITIPDAPVHRVLIPAAKSATGAMQRFDALAFTLSMEGEEHQVVIDWSEGETSERLSQ